MGGERRLTGDVEQKGGHAKLDSCVVTMGARECLRCYRRSCQTGRITIHQRCPHSMRSVMPAAEGILAYRNLWVRRRLDARLRLTEAG